MEPQPDLPIPISFIAGKYLLFSIDAFSYLRREHRICGMLIGTIPQSPSQNVFLGLPVQLMPEEAQLLVSKGVACLIDDAKAHDLAIREADQQRRSIYLSVASEESNRAAEAQLQKQTRRRQKALSKKGSKVESSGSEGATQDSTTAQLEGAKESSADSKAEELLFDSSSTSSTLKPLEKLEYGITPATSLHLLPTPPDTPSLPIDPPASYSLFKHLHDKGYFLTPGLRFGCQYTVYPGDPLRFHSHFLATGTEWDEEIDLMDIVGGGRLGTGVKKGYLLGGQSPRGETKTFSIEWAAM